MVRSTQPASGLLSTPNAAPPSQLAQVHLNQFHVHSCNFCMAMAVATTGLNPTPLVRMKTEMLTTQFAQGPNVPLGCAQFRTPLWPLPHLRGRGKGCTSTTCSNSLSPDLETPCNKVLLGSKEGREQGSQATSPNCLLSKHHRPEHSGNKSCVGGRHRAHVTLLGKAESSLSQGLS